ncbi:hypothetical protein EVAR_48185_1 [Eumeta japonica]|uniref:Uncharacterized protein n=1 Tax=Eumeta variegata TaxID=151549 RepID=A0A4C1XTF3_EUMVA|nr:hypothetical protein EVAR_48185_1 [Eumeta japonica]
MCNGDDNKKILMRPRTTTAAGRGGRGAAADRCLNVNGRPYFEIRDEDTQNYGVCGPRGDRRVFRPVHVLESVRRAVRAFAPLAEFGHPPSMMDDCRPTRGRRTPAAHVRCSAVD